MKTKQPGESILEILTSTVILVLVLTATFALINRGVSTSVNVGNRVVAINIAREGLEGVRNIRDTNWLKYSGAKRDKWLCEETVDDNWAITDDCKQSGSAGDLGTGFYIVDFSQTEKRYLLKEIITSQELNLVDDYWVKFNNFQLYKDASSGRLTHQDNGNTETIFYRQIALNPRSDDVCGGGACREETLEVTSRVQWREDDTVRQVVLETHLYDFLDRDDY